MSLVEWYLQQKAVTSWTKVAQENRPRSPIPATRLKDPETLAYWLRPQIYADVRVDIPYTGDGWRVSWVPGLQRWTGCGWPDTYTHPEVIANAWILGWDELLKLEIDCDDVACLYYAGLKQIEKRNYEQTLPIQNIRLLTLVSGELQWQWKWGFVPVPYFPSHVVVTFQRQDGQPKAWRTALCDTNGMRWADTEEEHIKWLEGLYNTRYTVYPTAYPWGEV